MCVSVESRLRHKRGFGLTPGKLLTLSRPNSYFISVRTSAQKLRNHLNLWNSFGRFDGYSYIYQVDHALCLVPRQDWLCA